LEQPGELEFEEGQKCGPFLFLFSIFLPLLRRCHSLRGLGGPGKSFLGFASSNQYSVSILCLLFQEYLNGSSCTTNNRNALSQGLEARKPPSSDISRTLPF
jgi:hypothetical protein